MPDRDAAAAGLASLLTAGDPKAVAAAYREWEPQLRTMVREHLHAGLRSRVDSLDFVQEMWLAFLDRRTEKVFTSDADAIAYLGAVAHHKIVDMERRRGAGGANDRAREAPMEAYEHGAAEAAAAPPTPSQFAIADEAFSRILKQIPRGHWPIVECIREGYTNEDISRLTKVSVSTVNRVVKRIKEIAEA